MTKLRNALLVFTFAAGIAFAADPTLLNLVTPDATVIAGARVDKAKDSAFGQYVLTHMQSDDPDFQKFIVETGFDPRRDVTEVLMAATGTGTLNHGVLIARGVFNPAKIIGTVETQGGVVTNFAGVNIVSGGTGEGQASIAFLDPGLAVMGDLDSVKAVITRHNGNSAAVSNLIGKVHDVSAQNDFWFVTLAPLSDFAGKMPDPNLSGIMKQTTLLQGIQQISGGIRFGDNVLINAEAITRSEKDATALSDVVHFLANLIQGSSSKDPNASQVASLLNALDVKTDGNIVHLSLSIPEAQLEHLIDTAHEQASAPHKRHRIN